MSNILRLSNKVAIITGGASGIGEAATRLFVENGASVVIADIQDELGLKVVDSLMNINSANKISYFHCDVRDEKQVEATVCYTLKKYERLDIMFSNAGIFGPMTTILDLDIQKLDDVFAINVRGVASTIKHAARAMVDRKVKGSIICTASVASFLGGAGPHSYTASKHAVVGLVKAACAELGAYGIRVNCISPFGVATPLTCNAYGMSPREMEEANCMTSNLKGVVLKAKNVAETALFLSSDESEYISGQNLAIDGGFTVVNHTYSSS